MVNPAILAGTVALFALTGVNAGPCYPSPSVTTTAASTPIAATETLSLSLSAIETISTTDAAESETTTVIATDIETTTTKAAETTSTANPADSETLTAATAGIGTTTADAVTTTGAESTAAATTTNASQEEPELKCNGLSSLYTAAGGASYQLLCGQIGVGARVLGEADFQVTSYQECLDACSLISSCWGVNFHNSQFICTIWSQVNGFYDDAEYSTSKRLSS